MNDSYHYTCTECGKIFECHEEQPDGYICPDCQQKPETKPLPSLSDVMDWWLAMPLEERKERIKVPVEHFSSWFMSFPPAMREFLCCLSEEFLPLFWEGLPKEYFPQWRSDFVKGYRRAIDEQTEREKKRPRPKRPQRVADYVYDFPDRLMMAGLNYSTSYISMDVHPDFYKEFPPEKRPNPEAKAFLHCWGYLIHTLEGDVLVDIDGSRHRPTRNNPRVKFDDGKRKYLTDGMQAYIVQCYDDNLTDNTPVEDVATGKKMTFRQWISIIKWMNMPEKERNKVANAK